MSKKKPKKAEPPRLIVKIVKEPDDPICARASCGGNDAIGFYLVYRGDPLVVLHVLDTVSQSLRAVVASGRLDTEETRQ